MTVVDLRSSLLMSRIEQWTKFLIVVHDGKDISVTQTVSQPACVPASPTRFLLLNTHFDRVRVQRPESIDIERLKTKEWHHDEMRFIVTEHVVDDHSILRRSEEQNSHQDAFVEWKHMDTLRHMLDSLVAIMEEERLPVKHLSTIEDTRPTIRIPLYGPYPITTQLFATVVSSMIGAFATSFTVVLGQVLLES